MTQTIKHTSNWTRGQQLARLAWSIVQATLFRWSPHNAYAWRALLLRTFGATLGANVRVRPTVRIEIPWHLEIGPNSSVGDFAILYCLGRVTLGTHVTISQYAHLCAGTHDFAKLDMPLLRLPIEVGDDAWICADAFIGPNVTIGKLAVIGARSSVYKDIPASKVCAGNPARPIKDRQLS